jgi:hypothetical protein
VKLHFRRDICKFNQMIRDCRLRHKDHFLDMIQQMELIVLCFKISLVNPCVIYTCLQEVFCEVEDNEYDKKAVSFAFLRRELVKQVINK